MTTFEERKEPDFHRAALREQAHNLSEAVKELEQERRIMRSTVVDALANGISENEAAKLAGITRDTVRRWVGK